MATRLRSYELRPSPRRSTYRIAISAKEGRQYNTATPLPLTPIQGYKTLMTPKLGSWKPGDKITSPHNSFISIDVRTIPPQEAYRLIIGGIIPRPIAFVSTVSSKGIGNLAPFSFFNGVSSNPPCVVISISRKPDGSKKDTLSNIEETGQFVVNSASEWISEALVHCAAAYPQGVDEMEKVGLTPLASTVVRPARVQECALQMECSLHQMVEIGDGSPGSTTLVIGKILMFHGADGVLKNGRIDAAALRPIGRLGGISYTTLGNVFDLEVPKV